MKSVLERDGRSQNDSSCSLLISLLFSCCVSSAQWTRDVDQYPQAQPDGKKEERQKTQIRTEGRRCKMREADRLSKRYFRVCSWNCAGANRRGAVLEKMVCDFDVVCLHETRACLNRPLVLQGFTVIQRHRGRDKAIVVRSDLSKTVSSLKLDKWSTSSLELQGIRIEKPDERHKSLILIN